MENKETFFLLKSIVVDQLADLESVANKARKDCEEVNADSRHLFDAARESYSRGRYGGLVDAMSYLRKALNEIMILESQLQKNKGV